MFYPIFYFCTFSHVVFVYNTHRQMSQKDPTKKNLTNLVLNTGQLVRLVPDCVDCRVDQDYL